MTAKFENQLYSGSDIAMSFDMDVNSINMDWLCSADAKANDLPPWDPTPINTNGCDYAFGCTLHDLDEFLNREPEAFVISADGDDCIDFRHILSSSQSSDTEYDNWTSLCRQRSDLSEPALNLEFEDAPLKSRKRTIFDSPQRSMTTDNVRSVPNTDAHRLSPSLSASTSTEPTSPVSTTSAKSSQSKKTRRKTATTATADDDPSDLDAEDLLLKKKKKAAHKIIEKRYRMNMNAKFAALGNALPNVAQTANSSSSTPSSPKIRQTSSRKGASAQHQLNKSEVLSTALTYILQLKEENDSLRNEIIVLTENLLPRAMMQRQRQHQHQQRQRQQC
ncbi:hypothetical protein VTN77DRAFT_3486 [Rasamsonia byssochlamydoides]|uniref:uncharacterized protein n=1 Tax=Rasamsonia byssochlamydoides TaxID=89139 RepID=UPI003743676E